MVIKTLKTVQLMLAILGLFGIVVILSKLGETTDCFTFNTAFAAQVSLAAISLVISLVLRTKLPALLLLTPLVFCLAFIFLILSYRTGGIRVYNETVGKPENIRLADPTCNAFVMNYLLKH